MEKKCKKNAEKQRGDKNTLEITQILNNHADSIETLYSKASKMLEELESETF